MKKRSDEAADGVNNPAEEVEKRKKESKNAATVYVIVFFVFVMLVMLLAYFIQQRQTSNTISDLTEQHSEFSIQALENIEELQEKNRRLTAEVEEHKAKIARLEEEAEEIRQQWAEDVKKVSDTMKTDYNNLLRKQQVMENLFRLYKAAQEGGETGSLIAAIEPAKHLLEGEWAQLYYELTQQTE